MPVRLRARWVLGHEGGDHVLLTNAAVVVEGDSILHVGCGWTGPVDATVDYGDVLLAPGFIDLNALGDIDCTILKFDAPSLTPDGSTWSRTYVEAGPSEVLDEDDRVFAATYSLAEALRNGITTALPVTSLLHRAWHETEDEFDLVAEAGRRLGMRLYLGPSFRSAVNVIEDDGRVGQVWNHDLGKEGLAAALRFARRWRDRGDDLVHPLLVPSTIETCDPELLKATAAAAEQQGLPFRLHCCQSRREAELINAATGLTSIGLLAKLDVLGPRALLPHAVVLGGPDADPALVDSDIEALARSGSVVVHCPLVIARGGRALQSFGAFRERGVRIGLGTDTAPADMLMNLQIGLMTARMTGPKTCPADYMRTATIGGAEALGRPDLGRLQAGAKADIVAFDLATADTGPVHDPVQALFIAPTGRRVRDVWVAGRRVVVDGVVEAFDHAAARPRANRILETLRAAYSGRDVAHRPWPALFPPSFPIRSHGSASSD
jgi:cytosine/adenosine deaminase-related metal-dependent hydrolase